MLAGLLFAVQDADDRAGTLAATLPFAGMTLIEYQARLLVAAGASQIVIVVARLTPELLGAVARIGRRGVTVDTVRGAGEAAARLHPLSHLLVLADGLVTTDSVLVPFARDGGDALLVLEGAEAVHSYERIGGGDVWAGVARLDGRRLAQVAAMPRDYDVQSALLHTAEQHGALRLGLPDGEARAGHGIERRGDTLELRSRAVMAATLAVRKGWFDRFVVRPLARIALPPLLRRHVPSVALVGAAALLDLAGLGAIWAGQLSLGLIVALGGVVAGTLAGSFAWLRDEVTLGQASSAMVAAIPAFAALLLGWAIEADAGEAAATVIAIAAVIAGGLGERAAPHDRPLWWGGPPAYLAVLTLFTLLGQPTLALVAAGAYAATTLGAAIERLRQA